MSSAWSAFANRAGDSPGAAWRRVLAALLVVAGCGGWAPALASAEPGPDVQREAGLLFWWGDFAGLERLHERWRRSPERSATGAPQIQLFRRGLGQVFDRPDGDGEAYHRQLVALTQRWTQEHPQSSLAHAMHIWAWVELAWWYRGDGYANTVPEQAMAEFRRTLQRAAEHLQRHGERVLADTTGVVWFIGLARALGWDDRRVWSIARQGLQLNPADDGIYAEMLVGLLPKWGGSAAGVDRFIREAVQATQAERGEELYARLYSQAAAEQFAAELFTDSHVDWPRLQRGFRDWVARWPDKSVAINRFAYMACLAKDRTVWAEWLPQIGDKPVFDQWGSRGRQNFATCKRWGEAS